MEIETETARSVLSAMTQTIGEVERFWPVSKRGSNAQRQWEQLKAQHETALACLEEALNVGQ